MQATSLQVMASDIFGHWLTGAAFLRKESVLRAGAGLCMVCWLLWFLIHKTLYSICARFFHSTLPSSLSREVLVNPLRRGSGACIHVTAQGHESQVCVRHATPERRNGRRRWHGMVDGGSATRLGLGDVCVFLFLFSGGSSYSSRCGSVHTRALNPLANNLRPYLQRTSKRNFTCHESP